MMDDENKKGFYTNRLENANWRLCKKIKIFFFLNFQKKKQNRLLIKQEKIISYCLRIQY